MIVGLLNPGLLNPGPALECKVLCGQHSRQNLYKFQKIPEIPEIPESTQEAPTTFEQFQNIPNSLHTCGNSGNNLSGYFFSGGKARTTPPQHKIAMAARGLEEPA